MGNTASCVRIGESSTDSKLSDSKLKSERTKMTLSDVDGIQSRWNDAWLRNNSYHRSSSQRQNAGRPRGFEWERGDGRSPSGLRQAGTGAAARVMIPQYPPMIGSSQLSWSAFFLLIPPLVLVRPQNLLTFPSSFLSAFLPFSFSSWSSQRRKASLPTTSRSTSQRWRFLSVLSFFFFLIPRFVPAESSQATNRVASFLVLA